jgi:hypothetical protein
VRFSALLLRLDGFAAARASVSRITTERGLPELVDRVWKAAEVHQLYFLVCVAHIIHPIARCIASGWQNIV